MISCANIAGSGGDYLGRHLSSNDYWEEGSKITGEWFGKAAYRLGLVPGSEVTAEQFAAIGANRQPLSGEPLTARDNPDRKAWTDIQLSAPKDVSILALVGGDDRIAEAFKDSVRVTLSEMERFASTRERRGGMHSREESRATGNMASAIYFHDASRALDPQLHAHAVTANATWDTQSGRWMALQSRTMMEASIYARRVLFDDLAARLEKLGYRIENENADGFNVAGVSEETRRKFSSREQQIEEKAREFEKTEGRPPTNNERAVMARETRDKKLKEITTSEVRAAQRARLDASEKAALSGLVAGAKSAPPAPSPAPASRAAQDRLLDGAFRHCTERASVASVGALLAMVYDHRQPGQRFDASALHDRLAARASGPAADLHLGEGFKVTTAAVAARERQTVALALGGRNSCTSPLASAERLEAAQAAAVETPGAKRLSEDQLSAARALADSKDRVAVLVGDAGSGKTYTLQTLQAASTESWVALGPTTRAVEELKANGFQESNTVAKFLKSNSLQEDARGSVVLVDEAGLLSMEDMRKLLEIGEQKDCRFLLVGDPKQHHSVQEGDALRAVLSGVDRQSIRQDTPSTQRPVVVARLTEVRRQSLESHREVSDMIAAGRATAALDRQRELGLVQEVKNERQLFERAADHYMARTAALAAEHGPDKAKAKTPDVLGIARTWADIDKFSGLVRERKRAAGELKGEDRTLSTIRPLNWTAEERTLANRYEPGKHIITFQGENKKLNIKPGENWAVEGRDADGLAIRRLDAPRPRKGEKVQPSKGARRIAWADLGNVDVGQLAEIKLAPGDQIQLRANCREGRKLVAANGDVREVRSIGKDGRINLLGGGQLPAAFKNYTLGYAVTSHKSQGASVRETVVVAGAQSCASVDVSAHYVSSTRHKEATAVFLADLTAYSASLGRSAARGPGRELASEMRAGQPIVSAAPATRFPSSKPTAKPQAKSMETDTPTPAPTPEPAKPKSTNAKETHEEYLSTNGSYLRPIANQPAAPYPSPSPAPEKDKAREPLRGSPGETAPPAERGLSRKGADGIKSPTAPSAFGASSKSPDRISNTPPPRRQYAAAPPPAPAPPPQTDAEIRREFKARILADQAQHRAAHDAERARRGLPPLVREAAPVAPTPKPKLFPTLASSVAKVLRQATAAVRPKRQSKAKAAPAPAPKNKKAPKIGGGLKLKM